MKTIKIILLLVISVITFKMNAQMRIAYSNGYVMVGNTTATPITPLHVNGDVYIPYGQSYWLGSATSANNRLRLYHSGTSGDAYIDYVPNLHLRAGTTDVMYLSSGGNVGIGTTSPTAALTIHGRLNINSLSNFEIQCGASDPRITTDSSSFVFYKRNGSGFVDIQSGNIFSNGTVNSFGSTTIRGTLYANNIQITSDRNAKKNIVNFTGTDCISKIQQLQGITFNYKTPKELGIKEIKNKPDSVKADSLNNKNNASADSVFDYKRTYYGILAQDVQKVYPELVQKNKDGFLTVNYIEFIPILIEAAKAQSATIDSLKNTIKIIKTQSNTSIDSLRDQIKTLVNQVSALQSCCKASSKTKDYVESDAGTSTTTQTQSIILYQNAPNPFHETTTISMILPQSVGSAMICIYDLNGRQLECLLVSGRGLTSVVLSGSLLTAGLYEYALIADGSLIDTKKMVLTN